MADLVDPSRLALVRARARDDAMFLQQEAADEVKDRLEMVNRTFTRPAVVTGFPHVWRSVFPQAVIVPDDEVLALEPGAHDLVIHGLSLHWANDPVTQLFQCGKALAPDGLFIGVTYAGQTLSELRAVLGETEIETRGGLSPRVLPMAEIRDLGHILQMAGLALPVADAAVRTVTYADAYALMRDLRAMGEGNALRARAGPGTRAYFDRAAARYAEAYGQDGRIPATFEMVFLTGWAPHESQQKPLKPGSAAARLADALGAAQSKLPD
ncbi:MAG: SAM-dependent methyltransferase [Rhodobacterales bacterium CG2_30_65_12]|nr:MAG: SAM-dependent methyltransferase [Rhodobacterales bacterium CG2_30_65_12]